MLFPYAASLLLKKFPGDYKRRPNSAKFYSSDCSKISLMSVKLEFSYLRAPPLRLALLPVKLLSSSATVQV